MKQLLFITSIILLMGCNHSGKTVAINKAESTCTGSNPCHACKNCKYCKHCAKDGGTCGVCK